MTQIDRVISDVAYILDSLKFVRDFQRIGRDCNLCKKKDCEYKPKLGETVRFNCPLFSDEEE